MSKIRLFGTSSGYVEIAPAAAASNNTLTAPSTVGEIIAKDAAGAIGITSVKASNVNVGAAVTITESGIEASGIGITCANINGTQIGGRRNLVINGAMRVAQRGTSSTTPGYSTIDRFRNAEGGTDENPTQEQGSVASGTTPYTLGFRKTYKHTNGNQTGGVGATDYYGVLEHSIEARDVQHSGWNFLSPSSFITLSFWIKSSVAQVFSGSIELPDSSSIKFFKFDTPSLSADTWTKVTKTIPGNSNLGVDDNTNAGLIIRLYGYIGTTYTSSNSDTETWVSGSNRYANTMASTWYTTNDATCEITGVQLEVGSQATAFEHRSFGEELALCQRYFFTVRGNNQQRTNIPAFANSTTACRAMVSFPTPMRATPTFSGSSTNMVFDSSDDSATFLCSALQQGGVMTNDSPHGMLIEVSTSSMTAGQAGVLEFRANGGELNFSAEI